MKRFRSTTVCFPGLIVKEVSCNKTKKKKKPNEIQSYVKAIIYPFHVYYQSGEKHSPHVLAKIQGVIAVKLFYSVHNLKLIRFSGSYRHVVRHGKLRGKVNIRFLLSYILGRKVFATGVVTFFQCC